VAIQRLASLPLISLNLNTLGAVLQYPLEDILTQCSAGIIACEQLSSKGTHEDMALAWSILSAYIPTLKAIVKESSQHRKAASNLMTQCLQLKARLAYHLADARQALSYAEQAVSYAQESGDRLLPIAALQNLSIAYFVNNQSQKMLQVSQKTQHIMENLKDAAPSLMQSWVYANLAKYQAINGGKREISALLDKAHKTFFSSPDTENSPNFVSHSRANLIRQEGMAYIFLGRYDSALDCFGQIIDLDNDNLCTKVPVGTHTHLGVICKATLASLKLPTAKKDKYLSLKLWKTGIEKAKILQSELYFNEACLSYQIMEGIWSDDHEVRELRDLIVHW